VEALGRSSDFNPDSDPVVRVTGLRLRRGLARYYAGAGRNEALKITIPSGGYRPIIGIMAVAEPAQPHDPLLDRASIALRESKQLRMELMKHVQVARQIARRWYGQSKPEDMS
jgi:hypothetical protein